MSAPRGCFVSSTGTSEGKTLVACALAVALRRSGARIAAVKPIETGCVPVAEDALALARAADDPSLASHAAWYRAELPASPYAVELETAQVFPSVESLRRELVELGAQFDGLIVEGAGGLFVPLTRTLLIADLVAALGLPVLLVAANRLGVLSHVLSAAEAARHRGLRIAAVVLNHIAPSEADESVRTNREILAERLDSPVLEFPYLPAQRPDDLAAAASTSGLLRVLLSELDNV